MKTFISFLIFCLIATCNAELRTWTAINGKEVEENYKNGKLVEGSAKYWNSKGEPVNSEEEAQK